ncbi:hypothetical protein pb186bvf_001062 [Paramecium bursaria]
MHQPKNTKILTFTIPYSQTSDPQYPAQNLIELTSQPAGWQSGRFCSYPQEIILQFQSAVNLVKAQFLSHEKKIPSRVEVFVGKGNILDNVQFRKIGYFTFHTNEQSNWQARELKTVSIDENECNFVKLLIHRNYDNKFNPFNQVGFIALRMYGDKQQLLPPASKQKFRTAENPKITDEIAGPTYQIDSKILQHILALEHQKDYAISKEDYNRAKQLKARITELKSYGLQIKDLEDRKKVSIQNEDFDQALQLKDQIQNLKKECGVIDDNGNEIRPDIRHIRAQEFSEASRQPSQHDQSGQMPIQEIINEEQREEREERDERQDRPEDVLAGLNERLEQIDQTQQSQENIEPERAVDKTIIEKPRQINYDDMVIPAIANKNKPPEQENPNDKTTVEELTPEQQKLADPYIPIFGLEFCQKFFSKDWNSREKGLNQLIDTLKNSKEQIKNSEQMFSYGLLLVNRGLNDKVDKVLNLSLILMQQLLIRLKPKQINEESPIILDNIMLVLMDKLGDINERNKEECKKIIMLLAESGVMTTVGVVNHLIKGVTTKPSLQISSTRHIQSRLMLIYQLLQKYKINNDRIPYNLVMETAIKYLDHQAEQVRTTAIYIITEAYKYQPDKVRESLRGIRPAQMQILEELFFKIDRGNPIFSEEKQAAPKKKKQQQNQNNEFPVTTTCEFCGIEDKTLTNQNTRDLHLWKDCVMLTVCQSCAQVTEISDLANHMLDECEFKREYRQCEMCGCALKEFELKEHQDSKTCNKSGVSCPLCFQTIGVSWKVHLATCSKQERNKKKG